MVAESCAPICPLDGIVVLSLHLCIMSEGAVSSVRFPSELDSTLGWGAPRALPIRLRRRALSGPLLGAQPASNAKAHARMQWFGSSRDHDRRLMNRRPRNNGNLAVVAHLLCVWVQRSLVALITAIPHQQWALVPYHTLDRRDVRTNNALQIVPYESEWSMARHHPHLHAQLLDYQYAQALEVRRKPTRGLATRHAQASRGCMGIKLILILATIWVACLLVQRKSSVEYTLGELEVLCGSEVHHLAAQKHRLYCPILAKHPANKAKPRTSPMRML